MPKSETFVYFTKLPTLFINEIIPVSKALVEITDKSSDEEETLSLEVNNMLYQ